MDTIIDEEIQFSWIAVYGEDDFLYQFPDDGTENSYASIERDRLKEFHVIDKRTRRTIVAIAFDNPNQRLIYRKRISMSGISGDKQWEICLVGWQRSIGGENVQSLNWIFPDGSLIQTGRFQEDHPIFYSVELIAGLED